MSNFIQEYKEAQSAQHRGDFREAFSRIVDAAVNNTSELLRKIALIAESGIAIMDFKMMEYAIYLLEHNNREFLVIPSMASYYWFNLAILKANLLAIAEHNGIKRCFYEREKTRPIREAYTRAVESGTNDATFQAMVLKSHARFVLGLGRDWEAFALLHRAMELNPEDNEVVLERIEVLTSLVGCVPILEKDLLAEGYYYLDYLNLSLKSSQTAGRLDEDHFTGSMDEGMKSLAARIGEKPESEFSFVRGSILSESDVEHYVIMHALRNRLYLSPCADCRKCDLSVGDAMGLDPIHVPLGGRGARDYRRVFRVVGRLMERYRSMRLALAEHDLILNGKDIPVFSRLTGTGRDEDAQSRARPLEGWQSMEPASMNLVTALGATPQFFDSMATCLSLFIGREDTDVSLEEVMRMIDRDIRNPALHAFWDIWQDGRDRIIEGAELPYLMAGGILSEECEKFCLNPKELSRKTAGFMRWLRYLIGYFVQIYDREARGNKEQPSLWPLEVFIFPPEN